MLCCHEHVLKSIALASLLLCLICPYASQAQEIVREPSPAERFAWHPDYDKAFSDRLELWRSGWTRPQYLNPAFQITLPDFKACKKGELTYHSWPSWLTLPARLEHLPKCYYYIACYDGIAYPITCTAKGFLEFKEEVQGCVLVNQSTCANAATLGWINPSDPKFRCPKPNGKFSPGRMWCGAYLECINNNFFVRRCPGQLAFNSQTGECDEETEKTFCAYSIWRRKDMPGGIIAKPNVRPYYVPLFSESPTPVGCEGMTGTYVPEEKILVHPSIPSLRDCKKFYACNKNKWHYCDYLHEFNVHEGQCLYTGRTVCVLQDVDYECPEPFGNFPNPLDCNAYYHCEASQPRLKGCPKGTSFSIKEASCGPKSPNCPLPSEVFKVMELLEYSAGGSRLGDPSLHFEDQEPTESPHQKRPAASGWRNRPMGLSPQQLRLQ